MRNETHLRVACVFPWWLARSVGMELVMHSVCFGLPLALLIAGNERRVYRLGEVH